MAEIYEFVLISLTLITAFLAVRFERLTYSVVAFLFMSVLTALLFIVLSAPYAAIFQLLIYAGAVVILILITLHTIKRW
ncbi:MAG: NADH-quinone oxidoreductase subunit J [archaeon]|nr:NADH-quinone oxidoreductase subunit J [archaeon]MCP8320361.1 NADH-quinone oxidoreductase subunit J [archaeon]